MKRQKMRGELTASPHESHSLRPHTSGNGAEFAASEAVISLIGLPQAFGVPRRCLCQYQSNPISKPG